MLTVKLFDISSKYVCIYIYNYICTCMHIYIYTYVCKCYIDNAGSQNLNPTPGPMVSNELRLM